MKPSERIKDIFNEIYHPSHEFGDTAVAHIALKQIEAIKKYLDEQAEHKEE